MNNASKSSADKIAKSKHSLEKRRAAIMAIKDKIDKNKITEFAIKFQEHVFYNIKQNTDLAGKILNWKFIEDIGERRKVFEQVTYILASFCPNSIGVRSLTWDEESTGSEGWYLGHGIFDYGWQYAYRHDFNEILECLTHEVTHMFQESLVSTLSADVVETAYEYYIQPEEDYELYQDNPIEEEANIIARIVARDFVELLNDALVRRD